MESTNQETTTKSTGIISVIMDSSLRIPDSFSAGGSDTLMSNFDGQINQKVADEIKGKPLHAHYSGWNFSAQVFWLNNKWCCEVWCYGSWRETVIEDTLQEIMDEVCSKYGYG